MTSSRPAHAVVLRGPGGSGSAGVARPFEDVLVFELDPGDGGVPGLWALPIDAVEEVVPWRASTPVPCAPREVLGLLWARGRAVTLLDVRPCLGLPGVPPTRTARIVFTWADGELVGLLVDAVRGVVRIEAGMVESAPLALGPTRRAARALARVPASRLQAGARRDLDRTDSGGRVLVVVLEPGALETR